MAMRKRVYFQQVCSLCTQLFRVLVSLFRKYFKFGLQFQVRSVSLAGVGYYAWRGTSQECNFLVRLNRTQFRIFDTLVGLGQGGSSVYIRDGNFKAKCRNLK
jgi:hypothetical protein